MTNYPYGFDNNITLPGVSGSTQEDTAITALRSSVFAIEIELGITPSGIYPDVRTRLDILESRLQFGVSPIIPNDGYVKSPLFIWNVPQNVVLSISDGYGVPTENRLSGSLYMRSDGYANNELYVRRGTTWSPIQTDLWMANGDLFGTYLFQTVIGIRNRPLDTSLNFVGVFQDGYHLTWDNTDGYWRAETGFLATNDLAPAVGSGPTHGTNTGRTAQTVVGIQNRRISNQNPPQDGYALIWEDADNHWDYFPLATLFRDSLVLHDGYILRTNIGTNRRFQSPTVTNTGLVGITNLGNSTDGSGGASANYATILGGDRNTASGLLGFPIVVGGFANVSSDGYTTVVNGNANTASGMYAAVLSGTANVASAVESFILDGYGNSTTALNSFVLNGGNNQAKGNFSGILHGISNLTTAGATHSGIGWGQFNTVGSTGTYSIILGGSANTASGTNNLVGPGNLISTSSNYVTALNGIGHTINGSSDHSVILGGNTHTVSASSGFSFIGTGNNLTVTGLYATILNSTGGSANGLHSLILNGNTNAVTASFSTIGNGNNNTISGAGATVYATILDGYQNQISGAGGLILDGYNNTNTGQWSTIVNGNFNTINGRNSTILNGGANTIDATSFETTVITGDTNTFINSANSTVFGSGNTFTNAAATFVAGTFNNVQSASSFVNGTTNTLLPGTSNNRVFGANNTFGTGATINLAVGNGNSFAPATATSNAFAFGSNNIIDGVSGSSINGQSNISNANFANIHGQYGKARMFGQEVRANARFTRTTIAPASSGQTLPQSTINVVSTAGFPGSGTFAIVTSAGLQTVAYVGTTSTTFTNCTGGVGIMSTGGQVGKIGEVQWSRLILDGYGASGSSIPLQLQDAVATNPTFLDGYSYDIQLRILITNTSNIGTANGQQPVLPARMVYDILAHKESTDPNLILDNVNETLITPNTSDRLTRTPWTISISTSGNQLIISVDGEIATSEISTYNAGLLTGTPNPSDRRAVATLEMREISRI